MKILDLPLKKEWYNMIKSGEKLEEYREIKPYWMKRLFDVINMEFTHYEKVDNECADFYCSNIICFKSDLEEGGFQVKDYTHIRFRYGYTKRTMLFEIDNITIGRGNPKWGAPTDRDVFIIKLKKRIENGKGNINSK